MNKTCEATKQLDAEIVRCIKANDELTGYKVVQLISAPPMTIRYRLKTLVKAGLLDCREDRKAKVYSLPKAVKEEPKAMTQAPPKRYSAGRTRKGKSLGAMAFEGNGTKASVSREA
jgi:DNA-binding transcriptional ArsR family regulator